MLDDFRFALRRLRNAPGFTAVAILTLALAIGANTAIFSVADAVLFRPLPYEDPDRLFTLRMLDPDNAASGLTIPYEYIAAIQEHHRGIAGIGLRSAAMSMTHVNSPDEAEWLPTLAVSPDYLRVLGVEPALGRVFGPEDAANPGDTALIAHGTWRQRFGADSTVIGRPEQLGVRKRTIIGVLPRGFVVPTGSPRHSGSATNQPAFITVTAPPGAGDLRTRSSLRPAGLAVEPIVRLAPGVTRAQAQAELQVLAAGVAPARPVSGRLVLQDLRSLLFPGDGSSIMAALLTAAGLVLLIGCANLASMALARARRRDREIGVRLALGATPMHLVRPVLFEALLAGTAGSVIALLATSVGFEALLRQVPPNYYASALVGPDLRVWLVALGLGVVAGVLFALVPAWRAAHADAKALLQGRAAPAPRRGWLGRPLVAFQVGLAIVIVCGAAAAGLALADALRLRLGFVPGRVAVLHLAPRLEDGFARRAVYVEAMQRLAARGDVESVGAATSPPMSPYFFAEGFETSDGRIIGLDHVLPGYFETAGVPLLRGRLLDSRDLRSNADVAVMSETAARTVFPDGDAIGRTFSSARGRSLTVVGIVGDVFQSFAWDAPPVAYVIPAAATDGYMHLLVRVRTREPGTLAEIRREAGVLTPGEPVTAAWWSDTLSGLTPYRQPRFQTLVLGAFAALALGLTALGIFAIVAFLVASRTREMGVRMALGATPRSLVRLVVRQAFASVAVGIVLGLVAVYWLRSVATSQVVGLDVGNPLTLAAAVVTVIAAALLAAWLPARRAGRVPLVDLLRAD